MNTKITNTGTSSITKDTVVSFNYTLTDDEGNTLDQSREGEPLSYLHGYHNIIPGLESALESLKAGDRKKATISPELAYGPYSEQLCFSLPKSQLGSGDPVVGMMVQMSSPEGSAVATIMDVKGDEVLLDANHPLAGKTLHFDVEITTVRAATAEEIEHGHVHGEGGHQH